MATIDYFKLKTKFYTFYETITKNNGVHTLSIGGRVKGCVNISIHTPDSITVQRGYHNLDTASIPILEWGTKCAVNKDLERGTGTVEMIKIALSEAKKRYPYVKIYTLTDNSHIKCDNGKDILLLELSLVQYKQTWYEKNFGASILDPILNEKYKLGIQILDDPLAKLSFDVFKSILQPYTSKDNIGILQPIYKSATTYFEFFKEISSNFGKNKLCVLIVDWIDIFLSYIFQFSLTSVSWGISKENIPSIEFVEETKLYSKPANQNGGVRTRKKMKHQRRRVTIADILEIESM